MTDEPQGPTEAPAAAAAPPPKQYLPALRTGGQIAAIVPQTFDEAFRLGRAVAVAGIAPRTLETPEKCTVAILTGAELGLKPMQSLKAFAMINNRLTLWGDAIPALLMTNGFKLREWYEGEPYEDNYTAHCEITRPDGEIKTDEFSVADAKKAKLFTKTGPWTDYPKRMLRMRARAFTARDGAADVLAGMQIAEEVADFNLDATEAGPPQKTDLISKLTGGGAEGFSESHVARHLDGQDTPPAADGPQDAEFEPVTTTDGQADAQGETGGDQGPGAEEETVVVTDAADAEAIIEAADDLAQVTGHGEDAAPSPTAEEAAAAEAEARTLAEADPNDPVQIFWAKVRTRSTWAAIKQDFRALADTPRWKTEMDAELQDALRGALWQHVATVIVGAGQDRVDHADDPTAFRCWIETQEGEEGAAAIEGTLAILMRSGTFNTLKDGQKKDLRGAADARIAKLRAG